MMLRMRFGHIGLGVLAALVTAGGLPAQETPPAIPSALAVSGAWAGAGELVAPLAPAMPKVEPPPTAWLPQDPADSLYRAGREAMNRGDFQRAAGLFQEIRRRFPRSEYTPDAYYWEAFALYRTGSTDRLRVALAVLDAQANDHPNAATRSQADVLATRIRGRLARAGDAEAAERIAAAVAPLAPPSPGAPPTPASGPAPAAPPSPAGAPQPAAAPKLAGDQDAEDDMRLTALNALLQMDADRAVPILKQVLARRDPGSVRLRRKAVFLVSQQRTIETEEILLDAARTDPDQEVRAQAVFWLSQVPTERAATALDSILRRSSDREVQKKAIFALSQHKSEQAALTLRTFAERRDSPVDLRADAIFWLGQQGSRVNQGFLRDLYSRLQDRELKERVIFSVSQAGDPESQRWLLDRAADQRESLELREKALFWAGQSGASITGLVELYSTLDDREMREQLIFVYSQRHEREAVDKLIDIARNEPDAELRRKAIFWLGQSKDPRVAQFLLEIINQ